MALTCPSFGFSLCFTILFVVCVLVCLLNCLFARLFVSSYVSLVYSLFVDSIVSLSLFTGRWHGFFVIVCCRFRSAWLAGSAENDLFAMCRFAHLPRACCVHAVDSDLLLGSMCVLCTLVGLLTCPYVVP